MERRAPLLALVALAAAPAHAAEPGVYWEHTVEVQMMGFAIPPQTRKVCMPKGNWEEPPSGGEQGDCQVKDLKRTATRMTWKVVCADGTSGTGDMTYGPSKFDGVMTMNTQGQDVRTVLKGRKVGGDCDASENERQADEMRKSLEEHQARQEEAVAESCEDAVDQMQVFAFQPYQPGAPVQCKEGGPRFCKRLQTREGMIAFRQASEDPSARGAAEKLCKVRLTDVEAKLCAAAAKEQSKGRRLDGDDVEFIFASCPDQAQALAKTECAGRSYTSLPAAQRDFCTRYAREQLDQGEPAPAARPSIPVPDVKREILKGLFGR